MRHVPMMRHPPLPVAQFSLYGRRTVPLLWENCAVGVAMPCRRNSRTFPIAPIRSIHALTDKTKLLLPAAFLIVSNGTIKITPSEVCRELRGALKGLVGK